MPGVDGRPALPGGLEPLSWDRGDSPTPDGVARRLRDEGVEPYAWSNAAGDRYAAHAHPYTKLLMCAAGSITFFVGEAEEPVALAPGDGFVLPRGVRHSALVGSAGCTCLEGHR
ncbi:MAG TPA: cupin domain-containing protein [Candidatus Limnocylindria bacterium]|nr:cupin domain-containing protein [Candidatus Limnocylindria bacterium]